MKKTIILIVSTLSVLFLIGGVAACKHGHRFGGFDEFDLAAATCRIASCLDLTESQRLNWSRLPETSLRKPRPCMRIVRVVARRYRI